MTRKINKTAHVALALSVAFWGEACLAAPPFIAPNGLSPDTAIGTERLADGTPAVTLRTMNNAIAQNQKALDSLALQSVSKADLGVALSPYLTVSQAASRYASSSAIAEAVKTESDRASVTEQALGNRISDMQAKSVSAESLSGILSGYLMTRDADSRYATATALSSAVAGEQARATQVENSQADQITALQGSSVSKSSLSNTLSAYLTTDSASHSYATPASVSAAIAPKLDKDEAARTYLPVIGGSVSGAIKGGYYLPTCYTQAELRALPTPSGMALACYWDANNQNKGNLAVYALGAWRWVGLGSPI
ncbi:MULTISPECIES: hypothetical protein [Asaia]|uniref:hypothetical protein n=1 Tax=Asaia TaxID=91914 RepID=UPI002554EBFA|nr:hypothetical protein [Asaia sp. HumB]MDL2169602.1 hypothetical protein [Asaia sp. HumB]